MIKINEIFESLQGELDVGMPSTFIRLSGCNLIKNKNGCKWCDSLYSEKGKEMKVEEIMEKVKTYKHKNVIITGGEPLHQTNNLFALLVELNDEGYTVSLETNGTIYDFRVFSIVDKINCSPKLQCIDEAILKRLTYLKNVRFKFVYEKDKIEAIEELINVVGISDNKVWVMSEGKTKIEQEKKMKEVWEYCVKMNFNFTPRMHILIYDKKRKI